MMNHWDFTENGLRLTYEQAENGELQLRYFGPEAKKPLGAAGPAVRIGCTPGFEENARKNGRETAGFSLQTIRETPSPEGRCLELVLRRGDLTAVAHHQFCSTARALRAWVTVTNDGAEPIGLSYVASFVYHGLGRLKTVMLAYNSWCQELAVEFLPPERLGNHTEAIPTGRRIAAHNIGSNSAKEMLPLGFAQDETAGYFWQIEHNGSWEWELDSERTGTAMLLSGPSEDTSHWWKQLQPGESFESVRVTVAVGADFTDALGEMTRARREIKGRCPAFDRQPVIFNDYMHCLGANPTAETEQPVIDAAARAGAEIFCMDAGWYAEGGWWDNVGEWEPSAARFPDGIGRVFDRIRRHGMIPGIWLEPEVMGVHCPLAQKLPDRCFFMRHGRRVVNRQRFQLDYRCPEVTSRMTAVIDRLIREYGIGYFKFDYNIDAGIGTESDADSFGDGLLACNRAFLSWVHELKTAHPDVIFENCSSGGMRMDYAMLHEFHLQSTSDQEDYRHTSVVAANAAIGVLPEQAGIWVYPLAAEASGAVVHNLVSGLTGVFYLSGELHLLGENASALVQEAVRLYKRIRPELAQAIPSYPIGTANFDRPWRCVQYVCGDHSYLAVWRNGGENTAFIPCTAHRAQRLFPSESGASLTPTPGGFLAELPGDDGAAFFRLD